MANDLHVEKQHVLDVVDEFIHAHTDDVILLDTFKNKLDKLFEGHTYQEKRKTINEFTPAELLIQKERCEQAILKQIPTSAIAAFKRRLAEIEQRIADLS